MTHYLMISDNAETACGLADVSAVKVKELVSCPDCLERVYRWTARHTAAKAAWAARLSKIDE